MRVRVEVCVATLAEARVAIGLGVDSVEACAWLPCGGISPSIGFVERVGLLQPNWLRVLCRPVPGGFVYEQDNMDLMFQDASHFAESQLVQGVVAGGYIGAGELPSAHLASLSASEKEVTFHRAIDHAADILGTVRSLLSLKVHRVLTSGGRTLAMDGAPTIERMVKEADGRMVIAAAGGINASNVVELVERTGVSEVHFAAQKPSKERAGGAAMSSSHAEVNFGTEPDEAKIEGVLNALVKSGLR